MKKAQAAQIAIDQLRAQVIGLYKQTPTSAFELVIKKHKDTIDTVHIGNLGGVSECFGVPHNKGQAGYVS